MDKGATVLEAEHAVEHKVAGAVDGHEEVEDVAQDPEPDPGPRVRDRVAEVGVDERHSRRGLAEQGQDDDRDEHDRDPFLLCLPHRPAK